MAITNRDQLINGLSNNNSRIVWDKASIANAVDLGNVLTRSETTNTRALNATSARAVTLRVYRDNAVAMNLYSSLGFVEVDAESTDDVLFMRMPATSMGQRVRGSRTSTAFEAKA